MRFARALRLQLSNRSMTARKLAKLAKVDETLIYSYTSGRSQPSLYSLRAIRDALGCSWEDLLGG